jgi:hypothetical protein
MPRKFRVLSFVILCCLAADARCPEKRQFTAEDDHMQCPVPIPADVAAALLKDEHVLNALEAQEQPPDRLPESWFTAAEVHLAGRRQKDLVVMADGRLRGANVNMFWVFRSTDRGHRLVLSLPAHDLWITKRRWKGCRIIEAYKMSAVMLWTAGFRFDGEQY